MMVSISISFAEFLYNLRDVRSKKNEEKALPMKKWLKEKLVCPECLMEENPLNLSIQEEREEDVMEGKLTCSACGSQYPIHKGIAVILPKKSVPVLTDDSGYNSNSMLSSYLWSHFCDFLKDPDATDAYRVWSSFFRETTGDALDIGCSVGRLSFELSKTHAHVIGIDTSLSFIKKARELSEKKRLDFDLIIEGLLAEKRSCDFDGQWNYDRIDFIVADALALPFPKGLFSTVSSINVLEKVSYPLQHLMDINRVLSEQNSMFVFSDPFSWDESVSDPEHWLGGVINGNEERRGFDRISSLFRGKEGIFDPPFEIRDKGGVSWKIRKTENLWEYISSQFIVGTRN